MPARDERREAVDELRGELARVFGDGLRSLLVYDAHGTTLPGSRSGAGADHPPRHTDGPAAHERPIHTLVVVDRISAAQLLACAGLAPGWRGRGLATPLLVTSAELPRSLDAFPLEFAAIIARHHVVFGDDPFARLKVRVADVRRACEVGARSHLLHLREGFVESGGRSGRVAALMVASAPAFGQLLANLASLEGVADDGSDALVRFAVARIGVPSGLLETVLALRHPDDVSPADAVPLFTDYVAAAERVARFVDEWAR